MYEKGKTRQTKRGHEPYLAGNKTIGLDGFSIHSFVPCFHSNNTVNSNSDIFDSNGTDWLPKQPNQHFSTLRLIEKFKDLTDIEIVLVPDHHVA